MPLLRRETMQSFEHLESETRLFYGPDSLSRLPQELARAGCRRAFVVCGPSVAADGGLARVRDALGALAAGSFTGVRAHSPVPVVREAAQAMASADADAVIALGGGSAIVTARAADILRAEGAEARDLCTSRGADGRLVSPRLAAPKRPQFVIPSTPTTALAKAGSALLEPGSGARLALFDPKTRARAVFVHPAVLRAAPRALVRSASLNTLAMAVEGLESATRTSLADAMLLHALRLLVAHLPSIVEDHAPDEGDDSEALGQLVVASWLCGRGTDHAGGGLASVLGHAIGPRSAVANGIVSAIVLPHTLRFNAGATGARTRPVADIFGAAEPAGHEAAPAAASALDRWLAALPVPHRLRDAGIDGADFDAIAEEAFKDWFLTRNPRPVVAAGELVDLMQAAW